jgi:outer membrane protein TolC
LRAVLRSYEQQKADTVVQVVTSFETIVRLFSQIEVDEASVARMTKLYRLTKARERQGRSTRVDSLRVELQRGQAEAALAASRERLFSTQREFAELLGAPPETDFELDPPPQLTLPPKLLDNAIQIAFSNRLDFAQAIDDYEQSRRDIRIARRRRYPDLSLVARYVRAGEGEDFSDAIGLDEDEWSVGLGLGKEINPASDRAAIEQARSSSAAFGETVRIVELLIAREAQQQLTAYRRAQVDLKIAERNVDLARKRTELSRRLFGAGRGDNFSVTDAEQALVAAEDSYLSSRANASISSYRLLRTMGILLDHPDELKPTQGREAR